LVLIALAAGSGAAMADAVGTASGLPVPRFVSLKTDKVAVRAGPNKTHEIKWLYQRSGLPVEITAEFETWRRIRDAEGAEGWVYHSLLSGRRTGLVTARSKDAKEELIPLYDKPDVESAVVAKLEPGVIGRVTRCADGWCRMSGRGFEGWIRQVRLWGVYPNEKVE
jgi:SH3-like domain-containing protein